MSQKLTMLDTLETPPARTRKTVRGTGLADIKAMDIPTDSEQWRVFVGTLADLKSVRGKIFNTMRNASNEEVRNVFGNVVEPESRTVVIDNKGTHKLFVRFVSKVFNTDTEVEQAS